MKNFDVFYWPMTDITWVKIFYNKKSIYYYADGTIEAIVSFNTNEVDGKQNGINIKFKY